MSFTVFCCKINITVHNRIIFYAKLPALICAAERTSVMGTAGGHLQDNRVGLTGRPDNIAFVVQWNRAGGVGKRLKKRQERDVPALAGNLKSSAVFVSKLIHKLNQFFNAFDGKRVVY